MVRAYDLYVRGRAQSQLAAVEHRVIALYQPRIVQALQAPPAGCFAQGKELGQLCIGDTPILLELVENTEVDMVQPFHEISFRRFIGTGMGVSNSLDNPLK